MVSYGPVLLPRDHIWFHGPAEPLSMLISMAPITTEISKGRAVESCAHPSLAAALERSGLAPDQLQHSREQALVLPRTAQ